MIKLTFLGSGCWQGMPAPFGDDKISKNVTWDSKDFRFRTSLWIETENKKNIIVEITPDIRLQSWRFGINKPDACLISHWHWDHFFGLLDLGWFIRKHGLVVYGSCITKKYYDLHMSHIKVDFKIFDSYKSFVIDNIRITPIPVIHVEDTHGFLFEDISSRYKIVYLADLSDIPSSTMALIQGVDTIIFDATYVESDICDDLTHLRRNKIIPFLDRFTASEIIFTHIGSYCNLTHEDLEKKFPQYTIAFDGMKRKY